MKLVIILIICLMFSIALASDKAITSADEAVAKALEYTGFGKSKDFTRSERISDICQLLTTTDTTNSILADEVRNRSAWQVKLHDVSLHLKGNTPEGITLGPVDFVIVIDSLTGIPLRISSIPKEPFERDTASAEQVKNLSWGFKGLPSELPTISLFDLFNKCKFYPAIAKSIIVIYVLYSRDDSPPEPAWALYLRGLPSRHGNNDTKNEYLTTERRIYNAVTGFGLWNDNFPYPLLSNDK